MVDHPVCADRRGGGQRQQVTGPRLTQRIPSPQEHHHPTEPDEQAHNAGARRALATAEPREQEGEHRVRGDEDRAGDRRGAVEPQDEPHLIEEVPGQPRGGKHPNVGTPRSSALLRHRQHGERDGRDRQEPHSGEGNRVDFAPGHLEGGEGRRPHDHDHEQGGIHREAVAKGFRRSGWRTRRAMRNVDARLTSGPVRWMAGGC